MLKHIFSNEKEMKKRGQMAVQSSSMHVMAVQSSSMHVLCLFKEKLQLMDPIKGRLAAIVMVI